MLAIAQGLIASGSGAGVSTLYIRLCNNWVITGGCWWQALIATAFPVLAHKLK
jgi:hypothetical protein